MPAKFILITAPAKINLYLGVHNERDEAGYHRVDSVMTAIDLVDTIAVAPADELSVHMVPEADFPWRPIRRIRLPLRWEKSSTASRTSPS